MVVLWPLMPAVFAHREGKAPRTACVVPWRREAPWMDEEQRPDADRKRAERVRLCRCAGSWLWWGMGNGTSSKQAS